MYSIKSEYINLGGLNIHYFTGGRGEPLLIIHGGNGSALLWSRKMKELAKKYTLYIPDLPGFGESEALTGDFFVNEMVLFLDNFTKAIGVAKFYLMGHSFGGAVSAAYTLKHPEKIKKLILINSMCMGKEIAWWIRVLSTPGVCRGLGNPIVRAIKGIKWITEASFRSMDYILPLTQASVIIGYSASNLRQQTLVLFHQLSNIVAPTLVVWGDGDPILPVKQAYAAAGAIPGCQIKVLKGGHSAYSRRLPEFSREVTRFLAE